MEKSQTTSGSVVKLSVMMFLQFFVWGSWFVTLFLVLGKEGLGDFIGRSYSTAPIAAIIAPLFLGLVADRFFSSEKVMAGSDAGGWGFNSDGSGRDCEGEWGALVVWLIHGAHALLYAFHWSGKFNRFHPLANGCLSPSEGVGDDWLDCGGASGWLLGVVR